MSECHIQIYFCTTTWLLTWPGAPKWRLASALVENHKIKLHLFHWLRCQLGAHHTAPEYFLSKAWVTEKQSQWACVTLLQPMNSILSFGHSTETLARPYINSLTEGDQGQHIMVSHVTWRRHEARDMTILPARTSVTLWDTQARAGGWVLFTHLFIYSFSHSSIHSLAPLSIFSSVLNLEIKFA